MKIEIDSEAEYKILDIKRKACLSAKEMAQSLQITFFPYHSDKVSQNMILFRDKLRESFIKLGIAIIPYDEAFIHPPFKRTLKIWLLKIASPFVTLARMFTGSHHKIDRLNARVIMNVKMGRKINPVYQLWLWARVKLESYPWTIL